MILADWAVYKPAPSYRLILFDRLHLSWACSSISVNIVVLKPPSRQPRPRWTIRPDHPESFTDSSNTSWADVMPRKRRSLLVESGRVDEKDDLVTIFMIVGF